MRISNIDEIIKFIIYKQVRYMHSILEMFNKLRNKKAIGESF